MNDKKQTTEDSRDENHLSLSLVDTDYETGKIENVEIKSEKTVSPPESNLSFEFELSNTSDDSATSKEEARNSYDPLSTDEELTLSPVDFITAKEEINLESEVVIDNDHEPIAQEEAFTEEEPAETNPYSTLTASGSHQPEHFGKPLSSKDDAADIISDSSKTESSRSPFSTSKITAQTPDPEQGSTRGNNKKNKIITLTVLVSAVAAAIYLLLPKPEETPSNNINQIEMLLKQQEAIKSGSASEQEQTVESLPTISWTGKSEDEQISVSAEILTIGNTVTVANFTVRENEPPRLTPKQIVDGVKEPIWLDRFELQHISSDSSLQLPQFSITGLAYLRQRNVAIPSRRIVATAEFKSTINQETGTLGLEWEIFRRENADAADQSAEQGAVKVLLFGDTLDLTPKELKD